jgi:alkylhydroperoxidase family enzyme
VTDRVLSDYTRAPINEKLRRTLGLLEKMTLHHPDLKIGDVRYVMDAGVSRQAIQDALEVAFLFNVYDRLADAMGWDVPSTSGGYYRVAAKRLLKRGYK